MDDRLIFHIDVNSAFLSWEATWRVLNGESDIRDIPSVVGGNPKSRRGIVVAKSIPAKKYGITTGEPMAMAMQKCPGLVVVPSNFDLYVKYSKAFKAICQEYTPTMESYSIDEVFLDMSGMSNIYPDPIATAYEIKDRIRDELGFTVNVGIGLNKMCAKMASDFEKPDKVHTLMPDEIETKMWPLPVGDLFTCGKSSANKLRNVGIRTIGDLAKANVGEVVGLLGDKQGRHLLNFANGIDDSPVQDTREDAKGYSAETTVDDDLDNLDSIKHMLLAQADVVSARLRADNAKCTCVGVTYRNLEFKTKSHQKKLASSTDVTDIIYDVACQLITECWNGEPLRLIGLSLTDIDRDGYEQMSLIVDDKKERLKKLDSALDSIRVRYGDESVQRASIKDISGRINRKHKAESSIMK